MSVWRDRNAEPVWQTENKLAKSLGFTCVPDSQRGANWCRFVLGDWQVWSIVSWIATSVQDVAWQVARFDGTRYHEHYTRRHLKPGEYGVAQLGFLHLKDALEYAKQQETKHAVHS